MLELKITNEQKIHVGVNPVTATGKASALDGPIKATVVSGDATTVVDDDGKGVTLISPDNPGDSQVLIEADADLGDGVETISDIIKLTVAGAKAVSLGLVAGDPQPK